MNTVYSSQSHCQIQAEQGGVRVRCSRVPLEPGILLNQDQWTELTDRLTAGGELPDFAVELPNSWVTKVAPLGQEPNALYLWRDEIAALAQEIRNGRHPARNANASGLDTGYLTTERSGPRAVQIAPVQANRESARTAPS